MNSLEILGLISLILIIIVFSFIISGLTYAFWFRAFKNASDYFFDENNVRKMRISAVFSAIAIFEFRKIPTVWKEAEDLVEDKKDN